MDDKELARRIEAARTFEHAIGAITYTLRIPPRVQTARTIAAIRELVSLGESAPESGDRLMDVLHPHVVGIRGATSEDLCVPGDPEPLDDSAATARLVLTEKLEHAAALVSELANRIVARNAALQADRKN